MLAFRGCTCKILQRMFAIEHTDTDLLQMMFGRKWDTQNCVSNNRSQHQNLWSKNQQRTIAVVPSRKKARKCGFKNTLQLRAVSPPHYWYFRNPVTTKRDVWVENCWKSRVETNNAPVSYNSLADISSNQVMDGMATDMAATLWSWCAAGPIGPIKQRIPEKDLLIHWLMPWIWPKLNQRYSYII